MNITILYKLSFLSVALLLLVSCSSKQANWCHETEEKLSWLINANPIADAKLAIKTGNTKFVAVRGFSIEILGISKKESFKAYSSNNYEAIDGTGDDLCSDEHQRLNNLAREYASTYNKTLAGIP